MKLVADSGSTKTDWCIIGREGAINRFRGSGINPFQMEAGEIEDVLRSEVLPEVGDADRVGSIYFYGAGCRDDMRTAMAGILSNIFTCAHSVEAESDLLAAARALFGNEKGIACILGTGSNSGLYDGCVITRNIPPLGYVLGDEGSGAVLGRMFVNALFKGRIGTGIKDDFVKETGLTLQSVITKVYRTPQPNKFLASLSPFIHNHLQDPDVKRIVVGNFRDFFRNNLNAYEGNSLVVRAVGSVAYYYSEQLSMAAALEGYRIDTVIREPMEGLVAYHAKG